MESSRGKREFLKSNWDELSRVVSDQDKGVAPPAVEKPYDKGGKLVELVRPEEITVGKAAVCEVINKRRSRRQFTDEALTLEELSFLLWATQGVQKVMGGGAATFRTVPSGGARHAFETYIFINKVDGVEVGLYRYLPVEHKLLFIKADEKLGDEIGQACCGQKFVGRAAVCFIWTAIPYRMEWRYSVASHKVIALDAGHVCQNLYLASESIGAGTCAIGAYIQELMDGVVGVDGEEEFVIYAAPVGKIKE